MSVPHSRPTARPFTWLIALVFGVLLAGCSDSLTNPVPADPSATEAVFGKKGSGDLSGGGGGEDPGGTANPNGCVSRGVCEVPGVEVPIDGGDDDDDDGGGGGSDNGPGPGEGGGNRGGGDSDSDCDPAAMAAGRCGGASVNDDYWDCYREPQCNLRDAYPPEIQAVQNAIHQIKVYKDPVCQVFRDNAQAMLNRGLQVWTNPIPAEEGGHVLADAHWTGAGPIFHFWTQGINAKTVMHEAMHGTYWPNDPDPMQHGRSYGGRVFDDTIQNGGWETFCTS